MAKGAIVIIATRYVIAGEHFRYKKDVEARIRHIKDSVPLHRDIEGQDGRFVRAFFSLHPTKTEGVTDAIAVHVVPGVCGSDRRFEFYTAEGEGIDVSYKKPLRALTGLDDHRYSVLQAMRRIAHQQAWVWAVAAHGAAAYEPGFHVHHEPEFKCLVSRFLKLEGASFSDVQLDSTDGTLGSRLAGDWAKRWEHYHRENAGYELLSEEEHVDRHRVA